MSDNVEGRRLHGWWSVRIVPHLRQVCNLDKIPAADSLLQGLKLMLISFSHENVSNSGGRVKGDSADLHRLLL